MNKKILIPIIVIFVLGIGIFAWQYFRAAEEETIPVEEKVEVIEEELIFEPDETIPTEFCRRVITRAQLREITGYEGYFSFEVETEDLFITEVCKIRSAARLAEDQPSLKITLAPELENISMTVEELYELKKEFLEWEVWGTEEPEGIGERAFLLIPEEGPILVFIDADINRVVGVAVAAPEFNYEVAINLAKQVEANLE